MPEIKKGGFSLDLGLLKVNADISEDDRQCAWELYTEITTLEKCAVNNERITIRTRQGV